MKLNSYFTFANGLLNKGRDCRALFFGEFLFLREGDGQAQIGLGKREMIESEARVPLDSLEVRVVGNFAIVLGESLLGLAEIVIADVGTH